MEKPVTFESDGLRLFGMLGAPDSPEAPRRGVVLIHGWNGYRIGPHRILAHTAQRMITEGFFTLRFDLRGRGDSEGHGPGTSLDDMIEDALRAAEFLKRTTGTERVALLGICSGANVAIGAATLSPKRLCPELVLWSTLPFQPEQRSRQRVRRARFYLSEYLQKALRPATWKKLFRRDVDFRMVGRAIAGEGRAAAGEPNQKDSSRDIMAAFARFKGRALFVTGTDDPEGTEGGKLFGKTCADNALNAEFHLVEGATHSFYAPAHEREVIETTVAWLKK